MSAETFEPFVDARATAEFLGKKLSWVYDNGHLMPRYKVGAQYRFRLSEVAMWVEAQGAARPADDGPASLALVTDK